ncbi:LuxR C-terminal-related transcriptional regulator [Kordiimonas gwangyangensis]|uniref:LuxR C-terminal-related transcriptional regulator n=1 Tax=Kordiimonas gwangyangensis TaxID=288022 RepID=UPI0003A46DE1|nr:LuxR C-terminal-related transcriptional regulator [Kordiimonas gwangyangensis]
MKTAFPLWMTPAKASPPRQHVNVLEREELLRRLDHHKGLKLAILSAPAGFGKTTTLASWHNHLTAGGDATAVWLTLDAGDNDSGTFALYLLYALHMAGIALDSAPRGAEWAPELPVRTLTGLFLAAVAAHGQRVVLILDAAETIGKSAAHEVLDPILRYAPEDLHVAVATRLTDNLSLSSLRTQGELHEIDAEALKFTPFEQSALLRGQFGKALLKDVGQRTEGWPVALQLLKSAATNQRDAGKVLASFNGTNGDMRDYVEEHIVQHQPEHLRDFLFDMSILDVFDAQTADAIRRTHDSAQLIKDAQRLDHLLMPLEGTSNSYRMHPLFREALHSILVATSPKRLEEINLSAAHHFLAQGHIINAMQHALDAGAPEVAGDMLEQAGGILLWNREGMSRIRKAHELLPEEIIARRPRIGLLRALVLLKDGHLNDARHIYGRILSQRENGEFAPSPLLDYDLAVIAATLAVYEGAPLRESDSDNLVNALNRFEQEDKQQIGFVYTILCVFNLQKGHYEEAKRVAELAIRHFDEQHSIFGETYIYVHLGVIAAAQGRYDLAHDYYTKVQDSQRRHFIDDKDLRLVLNILLAEWHYEKDELATAERLLGNINRRLETGEAWYEIYATGYTLSTSIAYRTRGLAACLALGDEACTYIRREGLKRLNRLVMANEVAYLCYEGKVGKARKRAQAHNLTFNSYYEGESGPHSVRETYAVIRALAVLWIAEGRETEVISQLEYFIRAATARFEDRAGHKYALLTAIAHFRAGNEAKAFDTLEPVIAYVRNQGLLRFILDETPFVTPLLDAYLASGRTTERDHVAYLIDHLQQSGDGGTTIVMSRREQEVLLQLAEGHADKVIARNLDVSENTVRFHLKNIYSKLGVNSRLMAVSEASKHDLL